MSFFDIRTIFFTALGYDMSYIEFFGVLSGVAAITLSAKANIWNWPVGIINIILSFFVYYQIQLYPDMFLQLFFFVTNLIGWWRWAHPKAEEADAKKELRVSFMNTRQYVALLFIGVIGTFLFGMFASRLHELVPAIFSKPSAFPYQDSFITVMSVATTYFVIQKKIESWIIWIVVDLLAAWLYYAKGVKFYSLEYVAFAFLAAYGLWYWINEYNSYKNQKVSSL